MEYLFSNVFGGIINNILFSPVIKELFVTQTQRETNLFEKILIKKFSYKIYIYFVQCLLKNSSI